MEPAVKTKKDQEALLQGLLDDKLDVIATDTRRIPKKKRIMCTQKHQVADR